MHDLDRALVRLSGAYGEISAEKSILHAINEFHMWELFYTLFCKHYLHILHHNTSPISDYFRTRILHHNISSIDGCQVQNNGLEQCLGTIYSQKNEELSNVPNLRLVEWEEYGDGFVNTCLTDANMYVLITATPQPYL